MMFLAIKSALLVESNSIVKFLVMLLVMAHQLIVITIMLFFFFNGLILPGICLMLYGWAIGSWIYRATEVDGYFHRDE